ncbi:PREDICTED: trem-like transcript 1 protein isoform X2 [Chinchilla lanigera]|uniref:trem-like transcript 1 protein isoform X2 n=1 Tax=Chinchilla lanigera TaxID=34839 RepID=UPI00038F105E|nr:PREDICTED: trem-like transcript 1 protein isoform X2 [Chinchilla lanigera]
MGPSLLLLLLLLLGLEGWGSAGSRPEVLQVPVGGSIQVQCHYRLQDIRARKVWCRFSPEGCQPLVTSAVDRSAPGNRRTFLTDMGGGLLQVEMVTLQEADAVPGLTEGEEEEEETFGIGTLAEDHFSDPKGSASPWELSQHENSVPLVWGAVLLLGLLAVAVALLVVVAKRKGNRLGARGQFQSSRVSDLDPSSAAHHAGDSGLAAASPWDVPYVRLDSPPSFDTTYTNLALEPLSGKAPAPPPPPPLPPKVVQSPKPVTYATVVFLGGDKGGGASSELPRDPPSSPSPLS